MRILITNDDGIEADGIRRLAEAAKAHGEVWVVAPDRQCSAMSHSINLQTPVTIRPHDFPVEGVSGFSCSGTPGDCVRLGSLNVMPEKPDVVFSGINYGYNVAGDIQYSATVGAAMEAEFQGLPAIAFSEGTNSAHEVTERYLAEIMAEMIEKPYVPGQIWNVNFPGCRLFECQGILRDRKVSRIPFYKDHYNEAKHFPDGGVEYAVEGVHEVFEEEGTDYDAILKNYVTIGVVRNIS